jgi:hypothetical protein
VSASKDGRNIREGRTPVIGPTDSASALSAKRDHLFEQYKSTRPTGATEDFQRRIGEILAPVEASAISDTRALNRVFCVAQGQLIQLGKQANPENQALRTAALNLARQGLEVFSIAKTVPATTIDVDLNRTVGDKSRLGTGEFLSFLAAELSPSSRSKWSPVNTVTALYNLSKFHPGWVREPSAPIVARLLIEKIDTLSGQETFNAHTVCNLAHSIPSISSVFRAQRMKDPVLESKLFNGLTRAIENLPEFPDEQYVKESFLMPLREVNTLALSDEGASALCAYTNRLNQLVSRIKYINSLETISISYHGLNGIFAWHTSDENQARLTSTLKNLNDRLEQNSEALTDIPAGSILYGLRGIETSKLGPDAQAEVARTLTLVAEKLMTKPQGETFRALTINSMITGLTTTLSTHTEPIHSATIALLDEMTLRLPEPPKNLTDLGLLCGALVVLRRSYSHHVEHINRFRHVVDQTNAHTVIFNRQNPSDQIAWHNIHQMYALYERQMPEALKNKLTSMDDALNRAQQPSWSERRIGAAIKNVPGIIISEAKFEFGFEMDFKVRVHGQNRRINIEVDGVHHKEPAHRLMDNLRDAFFRRAGWEVYRVSADANQQEITKLVTSIVKNGASPAKLQTQPILHSQRPA